MGNIYVYTYKYISNCFLKIKPKEEIDEKKKKKNRIIFVEVKKNISFRIRIMCMIKTNALYIEIMKNNNKLSNNFELR